MNAYELGARLQNAMNIVDSGGQVPIGEIQAIQKALDHNMLSAGAGLQKAGVGYPTQGSPTQSSTIPGGSYAPLVPQSIAPLVTNLTFEEESIEFLKMVPRGSATRPTHEYARRRSYGGVATSMFVAEGAVPALTQSDFDRETLRMKYFGVFRQVTNVLEHTELLSGVPAARALEAQDGAMEMLQSLEKNLFWADSSINKLEFDGLIAQVANQVPENIYDAEGSNISGQQLNTILAEAYSAPHWANPTHVLMTPGHYQQYNNSLLPFKRADLASDGPLTLNASGISIGYQRGNVPFMQLRHLAPRDNPIVGTEGDLPPAAIVPVVAAVAAVGQSKWRAADVAGVEFSYTYEAVGAVGATRFATTGWVAPAAGQSVRHEVADSLVPTSGAGSIQYYNVYRAVRAAGSGATATDRDYHFCGRFARNQVDAGATRFYDNNLHRPGTAPILLVENRPQYLEWVEFLAPLMRPVTLSRTALEQFMIMQFGALKVAAPQKHFVITNVPYKTIKTLGA